MVDWCNHRTKFSIIRQSDVEVVSAARQAVSDHQVPRHTAKQTVVGSRRTLTVMACASTEPAFQDCEPVVLGRK